MLCDGVFRRRRCLSAASHTRDILSLPGDSLPIAEGSRVENRRLCTRLPLPRTKEPAWCCRRRSVWETRRASIARSVRSESSREPPREPEAANTLCRSAAGRHLRCRTRASDTEVSPRDRFFSIVGNFAPLAV